ncbi:ABC-type dipeptide/oligopeptide/nickel transport system permease component [Fictibacillus halophilus]|uniref:ABC-type dipeptide/oligopeptide/nickel transport system permease component n=1 Tax=Fictibacillus halophilus TaxID=1610490 RepID=A0ABV2LF80_9BACL|nr:ABC transporter permease subunit [Fictibacillus halophilus]
MRIIKKLFMQLFLTIISIILISGLPELIMNKNVTMYFQKIKVVLFDVIHLNEMTYMNQGKQRLFLDDIWSPYLYSLTILFGALAIAFCMAQLLTWCTLIMPMFIRRAVKNILTFLESLPDLLVFALVQMAIVLIFKKTGILVSNVASLGAEDRIYIVPIVCLMILPFVYFYKMMILLSEEELGKSYVEMSLAKGMRRIYVLIVHVTRNTSEGIFHFSKSVLWFMISNLLLVEVIFNIHGITHYMYSDFRPEMLAACLILLVIPFFLLYALFEWTIIRFSRRGELI